MVDSKDDYKGAFEPEKQEYVGTLEQGGTEFSGEFNELDQRKGEHLAHALKPRHVAMISIGGVIGTGETRRTRQGAETCLLTTELYLLSSRSLPRYR